MQKINNSGKNQPDKLERLSRGVEGNPKVRKGIQTMSTLSGLCKRVCTFSSTARTHINDPFNTFRSVLSLFYTSRVNFCHNLLSGHFQGLKFAFICSSFGLYVYIAIWYKYDNDLDMRLLGKKRIAKKGHFYLSEYVSFP